MGLYSHHQAVYRFGARDKLECVKRERMRTDGYNKGHRNIQSRLLLNLSSLVLDLHHHHHYVLKAAKQEGDKVSKMKCPCELHEKNAVNA